MLFVLGIGSTVGMGSCIIKAVRDQFGSLPNWPVALSLAVVGFGVSVIYTTPGGQFILNLVDFYGVSLPALVLAIGELLALGWVYGVGRFCEDIHFMVQQKTGIYWRLCWGIISPGLMLLVLIYTLMRFKPITYKDVQYPYVAHVFGWILLALGLIQIPAWAIFELMKQRGTNLRLSKKIAKMLQPRSSWGPLDTKTCEEYKGYIKQKDFTQSKRNIGSWRKLVDNIFA